MTKTRPGRYAVDEWHRTVGICVITGDVKVRERWRSAFLREGWTAGFAHSPQDPCLEQGMPQLLLADAAIPGCDSPQAFRRLVRSRKPVTAILFGGRARIADRQVAEYLDSGADDFLYNDAEACLVTAKVNAWLRRLWPSIAASLARLASCNGNFQIDRPARIVRISRPRGGFTEFLSFTRTEIEILSMLLVREREVVSYSDILQRLWGGEAAEIYSSCVSKHIQILRRKLGPHGKRIKTVYGSGYMFV